MNESIQAFLTALHSAMADGEHFRLDITRNGDSLDIITLPLLGDDEDKVPEEAKPIRSALTMPLAMRNMTMAELTTEFGERLSGYSEARGQATDAYQELLTSLKDAAASAKNTQASTSKKAEKAGKDKADKADKDKPASQATTSAPEKSQPAPEKPASQDDTASTPETQQPAASGGVFDF